jgi:hypothetical protein
LYRGGTSGSERHNPSLSIALRNYVFASLEPLRVKLHFVVGEIRWISWGWVSPWPKGEGTTILERGWATNSAPWATALPRGSGGRRLSYGFFNRRCGGVLAVR